MSNSALTKAMSAAAAAVSGGAWGVGVSGGGDSVALLSLLLERSDIRCHVIHLDHETRNGASADDACFVERLCANWGVTCTVARRGELERDVGALPANRAARFRALRLALFGRVCESHQLSGVILAHHLDDQAETIVQRLLRGSGPSGLAGMRAWTRVGGLTILRPLLGVSSLELRDMLRSRGQAWREDASNVSAVYQRNRVRAMLGRWRSLTDCVLELGEAMRALTDWARGCAPVLAETFSTRELVDCPDVLAAEAARRWLADRGAPREALSAGVLGRLLNMARDAGSAPRVHFPGRLLVWRRGGRIGVIEQSAACASRE